MVQKVVFMGTPDFAVPALEGLIKCGYQIAGVYTNPDKAKGRGQELSISAVKKVALENSLRIFQPATLKAPGEAQTLASMAPDLVVVAAYGQILPLEILKIPRYGCLNVHPSLLPKYRGPSPVSAAILAGDDITGVTIMLMDEGMDTGPVLAQEQVAILSEDTTGSLTQRLSKIGADLLLKTLKKWTEGAIKPVAQDNSEASYSKVLKKEDGEIDWTLSAEKIGRQVRAFQPWPGCYTYWKGKRLKVIRVTPVLDIKAGQPGRVREIQRDDGIKLGVDTGMGVVILETLQLEGKKAMAAQEFARGQRDFIGAVLSLD
jgi:methionyl-tRNA formyltransferase